MQSMSVVRTPTPKSMLVLAAIATGLIAFEGPVLLAPADAADLSVVVDQHFSTAAAARTFSTWGGTWTVASGGYRLRPTSATPWHNTALSVNKATVGGEEWRLRTDVRVVGTAPHGFSVVFDYASRSSYSYVHVSGQAARSGIYQVSAGKQTRLSPLAATVKRGGSYTIELRKRGTDLKVYLNAAGTNPTYLAKTSVVVRDGLRVGYGSRGGSAVFDKFRVSARGVSTPVPTPTATPTTAPSPTPTTTPTPSLPPSGGRAISVTTSEELTLALADSMPGDVITMADGVYTTKGLLAPLTLGGKRYTGTFVASNSGTAPMPIVLGGSRNAVIDGKPGDVGTGTQYGLYVAGADYFQVRGITVTNVSKGIVLDESDHSLIDGVLVHTTGQEGIHLRAFSSDNTVSNNVVRRTGRNTATYGEGIYVGSANSNWGTYTGGQPDASDRNRIIGNVISETGAESMDIKEGTSNGVIRGNTFDGAGMSGSWADSWIDLKGNSWTVAGNHGTNALEDGFQVHGALDGWGNDNVLSNNTADVRGSGYGFWLQNNVTGNVIGCGNHVLAAASGFANVPCT
jgi:hypothetical protein